MVSIKIIAEKSGFSTATVSRYINDSGYVSEKARIAIERVIKDLNYHPSTIARSMVTKKSNILGLLVSDINSSFLANFVEGVERVAEKLGYNIFLCHSHEDEKMELKYLKLLYERRVDGIIAIPVTTDPLVYKSIAKDIPVIFAIRTLDNSNFNAIVVDDFQGSYTAVEHLIKKGHKNISFVNGIQNISTGRLRKEGALAALKDYGVKLNESLVRESNYSVLGGYKSALSILDNIDIPTAFYAANQLISVGILKAIKEKGYKVPDNISLVSFDGFEGSYAEHIIYPPISSNLNYTEIIGEMAVKMVSEEVSMHNQRVKENVHFTSSRNVKVKLEFKDRGSVKTIV